MSVEERARHTLHSKLEDVLGPDEAGTLMGYLPPVGWADVATKRDLDVLRAAFTATESRLSDEINTVRGEVRDLRGELRDLRGETTAQVRTFMLATTTSVLTTAALAFAAARAF